MKPSELKAEAERQRLAPKPAPVTAGDMLAGDQYARPEWRTRIEQGDTTLSRLAVAHKGYRDLHNSLRDAFDNPDPELTPDAHFMTVKRLGDQSLSAAARASDAAREAAEGEVKALRSSLQSQLGLVETHRAGEIRTLLRSLPDGRRSELLQAAIVEGDAQTIAAVVEAPGYLSGLSKDQVQALRGQYEVKHGGDIPARIRVLEQAIAINRQTATEAMAFHGALLPSERAREIEAKQKASRTIREKLSIVTGE